MRNGATEVTLETVLISVLNVFAVYVAAFTYKLNWVGVMTVMIVASLLTAGVTQFILSSLMAVKSQTEMVISEGLGSLGVALISSLAVLVILTRRFSLPEALGISLLSGLLTSLIRGMLA
jgi:uncharacterized membrane protein